MSRFNITKEFEDDGTWFTVYVDGQSITGFRDPLDANLFVRWISSGDSTRLEQYISNVCSKDSNTI